MKWYVYKNVGLLNNILGGGGSIYSKIHNVFQFPERVPERVPELNDPCTTRVKNNLII